MMERVDVIIVGAGQAGLAVSHELRAAGIEHVVLERGRIGQTWRQRWDSFCLVTPNWTIRLPGFPYKGSDPDGFMPRDEIVGILEDYARSFGAPVREDVTVASVESPPAGGFILRTTSGDLRCHVLVLATGSYHRTHRPAAADSLPPGLVKLDLNAYRNERALPAGGVLVVGSGQSGAQISEELRAAGREVVLSCGKAPWVPRRLGNRDIVWWLTEAGFFDQSIEALPNSAARLGSNPLVSGHGGGRDLNLRTLRAMGVTLTGRFLGAQDGIARFAPDLCENVAWGDQRYQELMRLIEGRAAEMGISLQNGEPEPFNAEAPDFADLSRFGAVLFTTGFRPDYRSWLPWPNAFDDLGFPLQKDGASVLLPGLYFAGVHFLRTRKSALLLGVGEDASIIARHIALDLAGSRPHT
jgi:putative flavoprotein involved in K+ transport